MAIEHETALIAGAGGGIGRAIAVGLARAGIRVALAGRNRERLDATRAELGTGGYFTNVAALRTRRGAGPYMPAIRKAIEFFDAGLVTGPNRTITIDWKDE